MPKRTNRDNRPEMSSIAELIKKEEGRGKKIEKESKTQIHLKQFHLRANAIKIKNICNEFPTVKKNPCNVVGKTERLTEK